MVPYKGNTMDRSNSSAISGLATLAAVVVAIIAFFFLFLLPFLGQLAEGLRPLMALVQ
jgi:hypothetical protein